jgi:large subunit ribosomal protein L32
MAHPKRKHSKARTRKKRTHKILRLPALASCPQCKNLKPPYQVCPFCGYYKGNKVLEIKQKQKKKRR